MFGRKSKDNDIKEAFEIQQQAAGLANRAIEYLQQGNIDVARKDMKAAMKLAPSSLLVRYNAIAFHHNLNELEQALDVINRTTDEMIKKTRIAMEKYAYYNYSGRLYIDIKQNTLANKQLKKALDIANSDEFAETVRLDNECFGDNNSPQQYMDEVTELLALISS